MKYTKEQSKGITLWRIKFAFWATIKRMELEDIRYWSQATFYENIECHEKFIPKQAVESVINWGRK